MSSIAEHQVSAVSLRIGLSIVLLDSLVAFTLTIAQIVALVDNHLSEATQVRQFILYISDGDDLMYQPIFMHVFLPHTDEILRTDNQRFHTEIILHNAC